MNSVGFLFNYPEREYTGQPHRPPSPHWQTNSPFDGVSSVDNRSSHVFSQVFSEPPSPSQWAKDKLQVPATGGIGSSGLLSSECTRSPIVVPVKRFPDLTEESSMSSDYNSVNENMDLTEGEETLCECDGSVRDEIVRIMMENVHVRGQTAESDPKRWDCDEDEILLEQVKQLLLTWDIDEMKKALFCEQSSLMVKSQKLVGILNQYTKEDELYQLAERMAEAFSDEEIGRIAALLDEEVAFAKGCMACKLSKYGIVDPSGNWVLGKFEDFAFFLAEYIHGAVQEADWDAEYPLLVVESLPKELGQDLFDKCISHAWNEDQLSQPAYDYLMLFSQGGEPLVENLYSEIIDDPFDFSVDEAICDVEIAEASFQPMEIS